MKTVRFLPPAQKALRTHRNVAERLIRKIEDYAANPAAFPKVRQLTGSTAKRLRVGDYRVLFEESDDEIIVTTIGPRGSVYED